MQQLSTDRINLPVFHDGGFMLPGKVPLKQSVVPGFRTENRGDLLGVHGKRDRFALTAVKRRGYFAAYAQAPCFVFAPCVAGRAFHNDLSHSFFPSLESLPACLPPENLK